jgi:uncharacterized protein YbjT (DUF2867 family)
MHVRRVCLIGGTGFVGQHLATELSRRGYSLKVLTRRRERHRELLVFPRLELVQANVHDVRTLDAQLKGCDAIVNTIGILNPTGADGFSKVHAELPAKIVDACARQGVSRLIHVSALGAAEDAPSEYLRTKWQGEQVLRDTARNPAKTTVLRPSVIFGPGDGLFGRFAKLLPMVPLVFPLACAQTRFQPVYVGDVVDAICTALVSRTTWGGTYDLAGPHVYTLRELVEYTAELIGVRRRIVPLPPRLAELQARVLERLPGKLLTRDNLRSLSIDSVTSHNGLFELGISPTGIDAVVPGYLGPGRRDRRLDAMRRAAGRER